MGQVRAIQQAFAFATEINPTGGQVKPERLPTNTTTAAHPVHRWFNFIAGFSPEFVHACCDETAHPESAVLLDPFAGCATAPVVACQRGMRAIGFEPHPVFARMARAKLPSQESLERLPELGRVIVRGLSTPQPTSLLPASSQTFLLKLFSPEVLEQLLGAREALRDAELDGEDLGFLLLSKVVDCSSHSQTDGIYKAPTTLKRAESPREACERLHALIAEDALLLRPPYFAERSTIVQQSSENMVAVPSDSVSLVVTSPPYLNNFDYAEMTRMLLYFWGIASSWGEITDRVRRTLLVNTTTALKGQKERQNEHRANVPDELREKLDELVSQLAVQRKVRAGKKEYDYLVYPYFSQMTNILRECFRCMRGGARIHIMVADAALYGIHVPTPQLIAGMLSCLGFADTQCSQVRRRGHRWILSKRDGSPTGLGEYHVEAVKPYLT